MRALLTSLLIVAAIVAAFILWGYLPGLLDGEAEHSPPQSTSVFGEYARGYDDGFRDGIEFAKRIPRSGSQPQGDRVDVAEEEGIPVHYVATENGDDTAEE